VKAAGFEFPDELHYHVEHQVWARLHPDGTARVGVTAMGAHLAGDLYMCRPKPPGAAVEQGRGIAVVELAKSIVSVKSPVSGTVLRDGTRLDLQALRKLGPAIPGWSLRVSVLNALDRDIEPALDYRAPGRQFFAGLRWEGR